MLAMAGCETAVRSAGGDMPYVPRSASLDAGSSLSIRREVGGIRSKSAPRARLVAESREAGKGTCRMSPSPLRSQRPAKLLDAAAQRRPPIEGGATAGGAAGAPAAPVVRLPVAPDDAAVVGT